MSALSRRSSLRAGLALGVALSAFGCRALVGIDDLSVVESAGSGGTAGADAEGGADSAGSAGSAARGGSTSAGGHAGSGGLAGGAGRAGAGGTLGQGGVAGQSAAGAGGKAQGGGAGMGGAPPECVGERGPCQMCCHTAHPAANGTLDQYLRMCACQPSTCQSLCPNYCSMSMPESGCIDCLVNVVKAPTCNALAQCEANTNCAPLAKCMEACP